MKDERPSGSAACVALERNKRVVANDPWYKTLGLILAGGQARRFGADKRLAALGGRPLMAHAIDRLEGQVDHLLISANSPVPGFEAWGRLADGAQDQGPLLGIAAGLDHGAAQGFDWLVTAPADSPFAPQDLVTRLTDARRPCPVRFAASQDQRHPIFGAWACTLAPALKGLIADGERKIDRAAERLGGYDLVDWSHDEGDPFFNVNRPEDLPRATQIYAQIELASKRSS